MKKGNDMNSRIEQALNSLDGAQRAEPQPWLYARVMKKLALEDDKTVWGSIGSFLSRPAVVIAGLFLILVMNGFILFKDEVQADNSVAEQSVDSESLVASNSSFDYENLVQP